MKRPPMKKQPCLVCEGSGELPGPEAGEILRLEREDRGVRRKELLPFFGYSDTYTFDLERGARPLTWELVRKYREAIDEAVKARLKESEVTA